MDLLQLEAQVEMDLAVDLAVEVVRLLKLIPQLNQVEHLLAEEQEYLDKVQMDLEVLERHLLLV